MQTRIIIDQQGINIHYFSDCFLILKCDFENWKSDETFELCFSLLIKKVIFNHFYNNQIYYSRERERERIKGKGFKFCICLNLIVSRIEFQIIKLNGNNFYFLWGKITLDLDLTVVFFFNMFSSSRNLCYYKLWYRKYNVRLLIQLWSTLLLEYSETKNKNVNIICRIKYKHGGKSIILNRNFSVPIYWKYIQERKNQKSRVSFETYRIFFSLD